MIASKPPTPSEKQAYEQALGQVEKLNGNMAVLSRLGVLLKDPDNGIEEIAKLLQTDGGLSMDAIRTSNSVRYGIGPKITNVHGALVKVGYNQIISLIGTALSKQVFMKDLSAYGMTADEYWTNSYFCGVFLEAHAKSLGLFADDAYLLGLLHSIGRVVINELLLKSTPECRWNRTTPCEEWEESIVGFRQDHTGAALLKNWKFTPGIYQRVADQNSPQAQAKDKLLQLLDYARTCAALNHYQLDAEEWVLPTDHAYTRTPNFDLQAVAAEVERARIICRSTRDALKGKQPATA